MNLALGEPVGDKESCEEIFNRFPRWLGTISDGYGKGVRYRGVFREAKFCEDAKKPSLPALQQRLTGNLWRIVTVVTV